MEKKKKNLHKPTFDDQIMDYAVESTDAADPVFSGKFYDFMSDLLTTRDTAVKNELVTEVKNLLDEKFATHINSVELKVNELNNAFHEKMIADVSNIITEQWPNAFIETMKDYTKARDRKLLKYILVASAIVFVLSVLAGVVASVWYHQHYLIAPLIPKVVLPAILSIFGI